MAGIKRLAKETAIYGLSSILGRFLNWCLVPLYVNVFPTEEYGMITYLYAAMALLMIILTYGMETGFFRFANDKGYNDANRVYTTALISLASTSTLFIGAVLLWLHPISEVIGYSHHADYILMLAVIIALDAFTALPFAYLRYLKRPIRFASIRLFSIFLNITFNLFFILLCPYLYREAPETVDWFFRPDYGIGYIFIANLISSGATFICLLPEIFGIRYRFDGVLLRKMLRYSFPLLILGLAGIMNQTLDKILYPLLVPDQQTALEGLGIYGANYKIAIVMVMFIQAFRFAYEPFIFARNQGEDHRKSYSDAMHYFVIFGLFIFLSVMAYLDVLKYFVSPAYFSGLRVVPIVMTAEFFFGIFFNLSLWYKLTDRTQWGAYFSLLGCLITVLGNVLFVPHFGYMACAWTALVCYLVMMIASYFIGQRKYPIAYNLRGAAGYVLLTAVLYALCVWVPIDSLPLRLLFRTGLLLVFVAYALKHDLPLSEIPFLKKIARK